MKVASGLKRYNRRRPIGIIQAEDQQYQNRAVDNDQIDNTRARGRTLRAVELPF